MKNYEYGRPDPKAMSRSAKKFWRKLNVKVSKREPLNPPGATRTTIRHEPLSVTDPTKKKRGRPPKAKVA